MASKGPEKNSEKGREQEAPKKSSEGLGKGGKMTKLRFQNLEQMKIATLMFNNIHSINSKVCGPQISSASHKSEIFAVQSCAFFVAD